MKTSSKLVRCKIKNITLHPPSIPYWLLIKQPKSKSIFKSPGIKDPNWYPPRFPLTKLTDKVSASPLFLKGFQTPELESPNLFVMYIPKIYIQVVFITSLTNVSNMFLYSLFEQSLCSPNI